MQYIPQASNLLKELQLYKNQASAGGVSGTPATRSLSQSSLGNPAVNRIQNPIIRSSSTSSLPNPPAHHVE